MSATLSEFDHYSLETGGAVDPEVLSQDGTGVTYRAYDTQAGEKVLLRIFSDQLLSQASVQREFVDQARRVIELDHPRITRILDTGNCGDRFYYVLENPGGSLVGELVERSGPLGPAEALRLQLTLAGPLGAAKRHPGLLRRVWPRNLMTGESSSSLYVVAQNLIAALPPVEQPEYLAPEVLAGHPESETALLYSLGATYFYMVTGRPPFPANLSWAELSDMKMRRQPDWSALPEGVPLPLLQQLLSIDPRSRLQTVEEWEQAGQHYLKFAGGGSRQAPAADAPLAPVPLAPPPTPFRVSGSPAGRAATVGSGEELQQVKEHTQRLSLELTKRVQKELALTARLEELETELEKERARVRELTGKHRLPPAGGHGEAGEPSPEKLDKEWAAILAARKSLEREKQDFLKQTQRFSINELKAEASRSEEPAEETEGEATEESGRGKRRFFFFGRKTSPSKSKSKAAALLSGAGGDQAALKDAGTEAEGVREERAEREKTQKAEREQAERERAERERAERERAEQERVERELAEKERAEQERAERERAEKERAEQERVEQERAEQERAEQERAEQERAEQERAEKERAERERAERERAEQERAEQERAERERAEQERFERERAERERAEREEAERQYAPPPVPGATSDLEKTTPFRRLVLPDQEKAGDAAETPVTARTDGGKEPSSSPFAVAGESRAESASTQPLEGAEAAATPFSRGGAEKSPYEILREGSQQRKRVVHPPLPRTGHKPIAGAWVALVLLGLAIGTGLYMAYRTFFAPPSALLPGGSRSSEPVVMDLFGPREVPGKGEDPTVADAVAAGNREGDINEELRIDTRAFENFLLVQDEEWGKLLAGMRGLEEEDAAYTEEELRKIRQELLEDLERKAKLSEGSGQVQPLRDHPDYGALVTYLNEVLGNAKGEVTVEVEP